MSIIFPPYNILKWCVVIANYLQDEDNNIKIEMQIELEVTALSKRIWPQKDKCNTTSLICPLDFTVGLTETENRMVVIIGHGEWGREEWPTVDRQGIEFLVLDEDEEDDDRKKSHMFSSSRNDHHLRQ